MWTAPYASGLDKKSMVERRLFALQLMGLPSCTQRFLVSAADSLTGIRTRVFRLPLLTKDHQISRNLPCFQYQFGKAAKNKQGSGCWLSNVRQSLWGCSNCQDSESQGSSNSWVLSISGVSNYSHYFSVS